MIKKYIGTF